jgi:hypothetical protein
MHLKMHGWLRPQCGMVDVSFRCWSEGLKLPQNVGTQMYQDIKSKKQKFIQNKRKCKSTDNLLTVKPKLLKESPV